MEKGNPGRKTRVIAVANAKGGVAKTTNTLHLAAAFAEAGKRVLIIDLDASAGASKSLAAPTVGWIDTFDFLTGEEEPLGCIIRDDDDEVKLPKGIHLIPASERLTMLDQFLSSPDNCGVIHQDLLLEPIKAVRGYFDYVFLDTPPLITKTTFPAYKAADYIILSCVPEKLSTEALEPSLKLINSAKKHGNPNLVLLGVILSIIPTPPTRLARHLMSIVSGLGEFAKGLPFAFKTVVPRTVAIQEAAACNQTVFQYSPAHQVALVYRQLIREIEERMAMKEREAVPAPAEPMVAATSEAVGNA